MERNIKEERPEILFTAQEFLEYALDDPNNPISVVLKKHPHATESTLWYVFGVHDSTFIGEYYGVTHQAIGDNVRRTVRRVWKASSEELKSKFPLEHIGTRKDYNDISIARARAQENETTPYKVFQLLNQGKKHIDIMKILNLSSDEYSNIKRVLCSWGIDLNYGHRSKAYYENVSVMIHNAETYEDTVEIFSGMDMTTYRRLRELENPSIIPVSKIIPELKLIGGMQRYILILLEKNGIPIGRVASLNKRGKNGIIHYNFIATKDLEKAKVIIMKELPIFIEEILKINPRTRINNRLFRVESD